METYVARPRQAARRMEKMLLVNHREEQILRRRLAAITSYSNERGRELDRETRKVRNEWRYNSRLNYPHVAPLLDQIPDLLRRECPRSDQKMDPVTGYLLSEYRRNSQVIPAILSALEKDQDSAPNPEEGQQETAAPVRKKSEARRSQDGSGRSRRRRNARRLSADGDLSEEDNFEEQEANKVTGLVRDIAKLRTEMSANKKIDVIRSRVSFRDMLRHVQDRERMSGDSDTYTDGTCALLRRKMQKMRRYDDHDLALEMDQTGLKVTVQAPAPGVRSRHNSIGAVHSSPKLPALPVNRSHTGPGSHSRQQGDPEEDMRKLLEAQERHQTERRVARETEKYRKIQKKIGEFLEKNKRKVALPLLLEPPGS